MLVRDLSCSSAPHFAISIWGQQSLGDAGVKSVTIHTETLHNREGGGTEHNVLTAKAEEFGAAGVLREGEEHGADPRPRLLEGIAPPERTDEPFDEPRLSQVVEPRSRYQRNAGGVAGALACPVAPKEDGDREPAAQRSERCRRDGCDGYFANRTAFGRPAGVALRAGGGGPYECSYNLSPPSS
jgi:hypothetical protein